MMRKISISVVLLAGLVIGLVSRGFAETIEGTVEVSGGGHARPVRIVADNPELQGLAARAFSVHGAFFVNASAPTTIHFSVAGAASVRVSIEGKSGGGFSENVSGASLRNALLRAADAAVTSLTGKPGFFAGRLAFVSEATGKSEIYTSDLFFGETRRWTSDRSLSVTPRWAPDGRRILYTSYYRGGVPDIYLINTADQSRTTFISVKGTNTGARFSPDGSRVAVVLSSAGSPDVWIGNAAGGQLRAVVKTPDQIEATPSWSADGSRLVVASDAMATGKPQLYFMSLSGGMQRLATNISGYCAEPDWSHVNRNLIAFTYAAGGSYQIGLFNITSTGAQGLTSGPGDCIEPSWTSDGRHLIYTQRNGRSERICIIDTETKRSTVLSPASLGKAYQANFVYR